MSKYNSEIKVKRVESEGEFHLVRVESIKLDILKVLLNLLLIILTWGAWLIIGLILSNWSTRLVRHLLYKRCLLE